MDLILGENTMGHYVVIMIFGILSFMGWYACVFTTKCLIQQGGLHEKYWPKRYIMPNRKIRRLYGLKKREIPKWCYYQLILSFVYVALFVASLFLYVLLDNKLFVLDFFMWIWCIIVGLDGVYIVVCTSIYKM